MPGSTLSARSPLRAGEGTAAFEVRPRISLGGRCAPIQRSGAAVPKLLGPPPPLASTESRLPGVLCRLRWVASAFLRCASVWSPPKGPSKPFAFARTQARNTSAIIAACSAWVPGSVLGYPGREIGPSLPGRSWLCRITVLPLYYVMSVTSRAGGRSAGRRIKRATCVPGEASRGAYGTISNFSSSAVR